MRPRWGLEENVLAGFTLRGDPWLPAVWDRYAKALVDAAYFSASPEGERYRQHMMRLARQRFDWDRVVDQWDQWLTKDRHATHGELHG